MYRRDLYFFPCMSAVCIRAGRLYICICKHYKGAIRFVIPVVFIIKLDWSVCICLTQLYAGRDMYRIYYTKNNYMFRHFTLAIFRLRNEKKPSKQLYSTYVGCIQWEGKR